MSTDSARARTRLSRYAAKRSPAYRKDLTCGKPRLSRAGRDFRRWSAGRAGPGGAGHSRGPRSGSLAMADVHRQHRRRIPGGLLHHPAAGAIAVVELSAPTARHRILRRADHLLDHAGRDAEDDRNMATGAWPPATPSSASCWDCSRYTWPRPWFAGYGCADERGHDGLGLGRRHAHRRHRVGVSFSGGPHGGAPDGACRFRSAR